MIWRIAVASVLVFAAVEKHSGYQDALPETRAMQDDDNPFSKRSDRRNASPAAARSHR
jgi:hypothetical protein